MARLAVCHFAHQPLVVTPLQPVHGYQTCERSQRHAPRPANQATGWLGPEIFAVPVIPSRSDPSGSGNSRSKQLGLPLQNAASYVRYISAVKPLSVGIPTTAVGNAAAAARPVGDFKMSVKAEGTQLSQVLRVCDRRQTFWRRACNRTMASDSSGHKIGPR